MINFRKASIADKQLIDSYIADGNTDGSVYSFGSIFCWGSAYDIEIAEYNGFLIIRGMDDFGRYYAYPSGCGDIKPVIEHIMVLCRENSEELRFSQLLENNKAELNEIFPDVFDFSYNRDASEYVYSVRNMAELSGKKFHGKKGHVNAFFRNHTDISCDPITKDNISECLEIEKAWLAAMQDDNGELAAEFSAIEKAIKYYEELGYVGAILYADGKAVAFTMGEKIKNNTFCTHYEKTLPEYRDAYPVINNGFTKLMLTSYDYVNREEDTGAQGLRKAKLSYYPEFLLDKYSAVMKNDPVRKFNVDREDINELKELWKTVFGDSDDVVNFFFDYTADINNIYAYKSDGKCVSAFYLIDAPIKEGITEKKAKYLYAAATLPEYRKHGYMGEMIKYAIQRLTLAGYDYLYLYPANENLYSYYEKFGFKTVFEDRIYHINKSELAPYRNARYFDTVLSYPEMREYITAENYARFGTDYLDFAAFCANKYGVLKSAVFDDEDKVFVIGSADSDGALNIDEAFTSYGQPEHIFSLLSDMNYEKINLRMPFDFIKPDFASETVKSGMIYFLNGENDKTYFMGQPCM
ncbi:MAG: GNAT family N-acetyltransferase [Clostridia bacterium]|nr:GNAT family N-acetyltransferase [Clostridia bacterium]